MSRGVKHLGDYLKNRVFPGKQPATPEQRAAAEADVQSRAQAAQLERLKAFQKLQGFDPQTAPVTAVDLTSLFIDVGEQVWLVAKKKGSIELSEPVIIRVSWTDWMRTLAEHTAHVCNIAAQVEPPPKLLTPA